MKLLTLAFVVFSPAFYAAEVVVTPQTDAATCLQAMAEDSAPLVLKSESLADLQSPYFEHLLESLEASGVNSFTVRVRDLNVVSSTPVYTEVIRRVGNPAGLGWVQYGYHYMVEEGIVAPFVNEVIVYTPGGKRLVVPYESQEVNATPWSPDGKYLVLRGWGEHHIFEVAALENATEPDWETAHSVEGKGGILLWVDPHTFEFSTWCCGCSHSVYRYDIATKTLTLIEKVRNKLKCKG